MNENREMRLHGEELSQVTGGAGNAKQESALERMREAMKKGDGLDELRKREYYRSLTAERNPRSGRRPALSGTQENDGD